jgi:hypothetical protein
VKEMTTLAVREALIAPNEQGRVFGEVAGDAMMQIASERSLNETEALHRTYPCVIHHACLADLLVSAVRKPTDPPWLIPPKVYAWTSGCYLAPAGDCLRRVVLVSHWTDERRDAESRNWYSLGEMAHYNLPMQLVVFVVGQQRNGKRSSPWTSGFLHPKNKQLRFRKRKNGFRQEGNVFADSWEKIYREDHAEISREKWLESMLVDDVLPEVCFRVDIPIPGTLHLERIREMAARRLEKLYSMTKKPDKQLSTCDFPVPCQFRRCCHAEPEREPSVKQGFVPLTSG